MLNLLRKIKHCWISWRGWKKYEEESEQEKQKELTEKKTAEKMRKRTVERLGETRKRAGVREKRNGGEQDGKRKRSGEIVEVLKESIKAKKEKEEAEIELRERDMFNHVAAISASSAGITVSITTTSHDNGFCQWYD